MPDCPEHFMHGTVLYIASHPLRIVQFSNRREFLQPVPELAYDRYRSRKEGNHDSGNEKGSYSFLIRPAGDIINWLCEGRPDRIRY